jgi:hypothetical protein
MVGEEDIKDSDISDIRFTTNTACCIGPRGPRFKQKSCNGVSLHLVQFTLVRSC